MRPRAEVRSRGSARRRVAGPSAAVAALVMLAACRITGDVGGSGARDVVPAFERVTAGELVTDGGLSRGAAWGDFDGDGWPDLIVANTTNWPQAYYRNDGDGSFTEIHEVPVTLAVGWTEGVHPIDYDDDGDLDLHLANTHDEPNPLFRNDGADGLVRVDAGDLTSDSASTSQVCWADYDGDGDLDAFAANRAAPDALYENRGDRFVRVPEGPWVGRVGDARTCGVGDADGDGGVDIYVGNFRHQENVFYRNLGGLRFEDVALDVPAEGGGCSYGISWVDYDDDGDLDLFVSNICSGGDRNWLYENDGSGGLTLREDLSIVADSRGPSKGHAWGDYDNDGDLDLFVANGTGGTEEVEDFDIANFLYLNRGDGTFERIRSGPIVEDRNISAGAAWSDYDRDGDLDLYVANWGGGDEDNALYRNLTSDRTDRGWVLIRPVGSESNRMGLGARVRALATIDGEARWQTRWMLPATGYASGNEPVIHFGLGDATAVDSLEVLWPSGATTGHGSVAARAEWVVTEEGELLAGDSDRFPAGEGRVAIAGGS